MKYTTNGTTKRYMANTNCSYGSFAVSAGDKYQFGCEFEFYIDTDFYDYTIVIDEIAKEIYEFCTEDLSK